MTKVSKSRLIGLLLTGASLVLLSLSASAAEVEARHFLLKDQSSLRFDVPKGWRSRWDQTTKPSLGLSISISLPGSRTFLTLISAFTEKEPRSAPADRESLRRMVTGAIARVRPQAAEREIPIRPLNGANVEGSYFSITDKAPKPDEYKYLTEGMAKAGPLFLTFSIFSNDGAGSVAQDAIAMVRTATYFKVAPPAARNPTIIPRRDAIVVTRRQSDFYLTVPVSRLALTIPRGNLKQDPAGPKSGIRYFYLRDPAARLIISGWFEPIGRYKGGRQMWSETIKEWQKKNLGDPRDVRFAKIGKWDAIFYDIHTLKGVRMKRTDAHLQAHWAEADTWIELHLSVYSELPSEGARSKLEAVLRDIVVTRKN